jgi:hypothetical protein
MGTNLYQFGLAWNHMNNSKSMKNQKKLQLQKLFQITPSYSTIFLDFSQFLAIFTEIISFWKYFKPDRVCRWVSLVSGTEADAGPTYQAMLPTWLPPIAASSFARVIKRSADVGLSHPRPIARRCRAKLPLLLQDRAATGPPPR